MRIGGLVSGLDTDSLIKQLMQLERAPLEKLQQKQQVLRYKKDALMDFRSNLMSLQSKATDLSFSAAFNSKVVKVADELVATASANTGAANGNYNINVTKLATATRIASSSVIGLNIAKYAKKTSFEEINTAVAQDVNPNVKLSAGNAATNFPVGTTITADGTKGINVNGVYIAITADDTLNTVLNKITDSAAGVTASFSGDKVTLTQKTAGSNKKITLTDNSGLLNALKIDTTEAVGEDAGYLKKLKDTGLGLTDGFVTINNYTISIDIDNDSLQDVINRINSSATGVTAFYDSVADKISFTSKNTGSQSINIGADTSGLIAKLNLGAEQTGTNAELTVNGTTLTRDSNVFDYNGLKITAQKLGITSITVNQDTDKAISSIEEFVNQFNSTVDFITSKLKEKKVKDPKNESDLKSGLLNGEYLLRNTYNQLQKEITSPVAGLPSNMNMLALIGITTSAGGKDLIPDGKLHINKDKLRTALETNAQAVQDLFAKGTSQVLTENFTGSQLTDRSATEKELTLANGKVLGAPAPVVKVGGVAYSQVASSPGDKQYMIDYTNGKIIFNKDYAPAAATAIEVTYSYRATSGPEAGLAVRVKQMLGELTKVGGYVENVTGKNGGITDQIDTIGKSIERYEDRLAKREDTLWRQYSAMEQVMQRLQSQSQWLSGQLNQLPTYSSKS